MTIVKNLEKYVTNVLRQAGVTVTQVRRMSAEDFASIFPSEKLRSIIMSHVKAKPAQPEVSEVPENVEQIVEEYKKPATEEPVQEDVTPVEPIPVDEPVADVVNDVEEHPAEEAKQYTMDDIMPTLSQITLKTPTTVMKRLKELLPEEVIAGVPFTELQDAIATQVNINKSK